MTAPKKKCQKMEHCSIVRSLSAQAVAPTEIHQRMKKVQYGDARLSLQQVYDWGRKFWNGPSRVSDSPRPGQGHRVVKPDSTAETEHTVMGKNCG